MSNQRIYQDDVHIHVLNKIQLEQEESTSQKRTVVAYFLIY